MNAYDTEITGSYKGASSCYVCLTKSINVGHSRSSNQQTTARKKGEKYNALFYINILALYSLLKNYNTSTTLDARKLFCYTYSLPALPAAEGPEAKSKVPDWEIKSTLV
jgi:hypothetical protein